MPCDRLYYTLRIAPDLPQDIPALNIRLFPDGFEPPSPNVIGDIAPIAFTPAQQVMVGGAKATRLEWAIACKLTEEESLRLGALYAWQQRQIVGGGDARLEWIDRLEQTEPEPVASLSRDIIDAVTTAYGLVYGYPVVKCLISKPSRQITGTRTGALMRLCTFTVSEYR